MNRRPNLTGWLRGARATLAVLLASAGLLLWLLPAAGTAAASAPTVAAGRVGHATLQVSSRSAAATDVTYTVNFTSTAALAGGSPTIIVAAPAGTVLPGSPGGYRLSDDATEAFETPGVSVSGTTATLSVTPAITVHAGDMLSLVIGGVSNPSTGGAKTLKVSTSADPAPVSLSYTLAAKTAVTHATLRVSAPSAGATGTYSVTFVSPDRLPENALMTLTGPAGTKFPAAAGCGWETFFAQSNDSPNGCLSASVSGRTIAIKVPETTRAGDLVSFQVHGVTSPGSTGSKSFTLSTSADPKPVTLTASLSAATAVQDAFLHLSSTAPGATSTWSLGFVTPAALGGAGSTITIKAPSGTAFPAPPADYVCTDVTMGVQALCNPFEITVSGSTMTIPVAAASAGDMLDIVMPGVTNPRALGALKVSTTADTTPVSLSTTAASSSATFQANVTAAKAPDAYYTETFKTPVALSASKSQIEVSAPAGTVFGAGCTALLTWVIYDDTTGKDVPVGPCAQGPTAAVEQLTVQSSVAAGDELSVQAPDVTNAPGAGGKALTVSESAGGGGTGFSAVKTYHFTLTGATSVSTPVPVLSSQSAKATEVSYGAEVTVTNGLDYLSSVTFTGPAGITYPAGTLGSFYDTTNGTGGGGGVTVSGSSVTVSLDGSEGDWVAAGDRIIVILTGVTNPASAEADSVSISTTSDATTSQRGTGPAVTAATSVHTPVVLTLSSHKGGKAGVSYSASFRVSNALYWNNMSLALKFPAGTGLPPGSGGSDGFEFYDDTTAYSGPLLGVFTGTTVVLTLGSGGPAVADGDLVTVVVTPVTSPAKGSYSLGVSTSADPAGVSAAYKLT